MQYRIGSLRNDANKTLHTLLKSGFSSHLKSNVPFPIHISIQRPTVFSKLEIRHLQSNNNNNFKRSRQGTKTIMQVDLFFFYINCFSWMLANSLIFNMQVACCVHSTNLSVALVLNVVITITVCCRCTPFDTEIHFAI